MWLVYHTDSKNNDIFKTMISYIEHKLDNKCIRFGYFRNGNIYSNEFFKDNKLHRRSKVGPASIYYYYNGSLQCIKYFKKGKLHRDPNKGPAMILYLEDGSIIAEIYIKNGKMIVPSGQKSHFVYHRL